MKKTRPKNKAPLKRPDAPTLRKLAVAASVDPRTLNRLLRGLPVRGDAGHRGRRVLEDNGFLPKQAHS